MVENEKIFKKLKGNNSTKIRNFFLWLALISIYLNIFMVPIFGYHIYEYHKATKNFDKTTDEMHELSHVFAMEGYLDAVTVWIENKDNQGKIKQIYIDKLEDYERTGIYEKKYDSLWVK